MLPLEKSASASHGLRGNLDSISATICFCVGGVVAVAGQLHQQVEAARAVFVCRIGQSAGLGRGQPLQLQLAGGFGHRKAVAGLRRPAPARAPGRDTARLPRNSGRHCSRHRPGCAARPTVSVASAPICVSLARAVCASGLKGCASKRCLKVVVRCLLLAERQLHLAPRPVESRAGPRLRCPWPAASTCARLRLDCSKPATRWPRARALRRRRCSRDSGR